MGDLLTFKVLMLGDSGVGKSSIMIRFASGEYDETTMISTTGIDFKQRDIVVNQEQIRLQVFDTAGQERFHTLATSVYRGVAGVVLVYDVGDASSFENVWSWMASIQKKAGTNVHVILVGNKVDLPHREVSTKAGDDLAQKYNIPFIEVSAKRNFGIEDAFTILSEDILSNRELVAREIRRMNEKRENRAVTLHKQRKKNRMCNLA